MWVYLYPNSTETELKNAYIWEYVPPIPYLCFTAETANSVFQLQKNWYPASVEIETSTNWTTWTDYTFWTNITLVNVWDKIYFRNKSETTTYFSTNSSNYYKFVISNAYRIAASWDVNYLINKNSTDTLIDSYCFNQLFLWCRGLTMPPELPATTLRASCYSNMFQNCDHMVWIPKLPATTVPEYAYYRMFYICSSLKISATQDSDYTQEYRMPTTWTWTSSTYSLQEMFNQTWWSMAYTTPTINTTYYVHKDNIIV